MSERTVGFAEIAGVFLKIGAMSYGGPAIMGIMQTEIQEKREWISKPEFVEGLALVNMLPGPGATQLGIFIGHAKAGLAGGVIAGLCFVLPAFLIMLALASAYVAFGTLPSVRNAFYGIGPVVVGFLLPRCTASAKGRSGSVPKSRSVSPLRSRCSLHRLALSYPSWLRDVLE